MAEKTKQDGRWTPGPWRVLENIPGERGSLCGKAKEGHDTVVNACDPEAHVEILSSVDAMRRSQVFGSGSGGHLARIVWPPSDGARAAALANARLIAAAPDLVHVIHEAWRDLEDILTSNVPGGHPDIDDQTRRDLQATADALWAAFAKVEGR